MAWHWTGHKPLPESILKKIHNAKWHTVSLGPNELPYISTEHRCLLKVQEHLCGLKYWNSRRFPASIIRFQHYDVLPWKCFVHYWPFVRGIHCYPGTVPWSWVSATPHKTWCWYLQFIWGLGTQIWNLWVMILTHCGLVTPYGDRDLGQHWLR